MTLTAGGGHVVVSAFIVGAWCGAVAMLAVVAVLVAPVLAACRRRRRAEAGGCTPACGEAHTFRSGCQLAVRR